LHWANYSHAITSTKRALFRVMTPSALLLQFTDPNVVRNHFGWSVLQSLSRNHWMAPGDGYTQVKVGTAGKRGQLPGIRQDAAVFGTSN
jgi:hypothetical protein